MKKDVWGSEDVQNRVVVFTLLILTLTVFLQIRSYEFSGLDDHSYFTGNAHVQRGLTMDGLRWAFTNNHFTYWHPLTWISHMLGVQFFGLDPGWHHLVNLLLHVFNTLLLFRILLTMTRRRWPSAFVAALFAIHPLHVESVAWVSTRTDVLSTFFMFLAIWSYALHARKPSRARYAKIVFFFILGIMSKPMVLTLPLLLLLLDYWPLNRFEPGNSARIPASLLLLEKVPLVILAALSAVVTYITMQEVGGTTSFESYSFGTRTANSLVAYAWYIVKFLWPLDLAVHYPHPLTGLPYWKVAASGIFLSFMTLSAFFLRKRHPYVFVGWLWYIVTLLPVIGIIQAGGVAVADRYTYISLVGLFIIVAWGTSDFVPEVPSKRWILRVAGGVVLLVASSLSWHQAGHWKNSVQLFRHAVDVTSENWKAHYLLGNAFYSREQWDVAITQYKESIRIQPNFPDSHNNAGLALSNQGLSIEAITHFQEALRLKPDKPSTLNNLGRELERLGFVNKAASYYREALRFQPNLPNAHFNLGNILLSQGKASEAANHFREALRMMPENSTIEQSLQRAMDMRESQM